MRFRFDDLGVEEVGGTGYLLDRGPYGLAAALVGFVTPAWGLATDTRSRPVLPFDGATQYATLPFRFYDHAPTGEVSCLVFAEAAPSTPTFFDCRNAAPDRGFRIYCDTMTTLRIEGYDAAGAVFTATASGVAWDRRTVLAIGVRPGTGEVRAWQDGVRLAAAFAGTNNPIACDTSIVPHLCADVGAGAGLFTGTLTALALWSHILVDSEVDTLTSRAWDRWGS